MLEYCEIMDAGGEHDKQMPNGVGARELTVGLEEEYANEIEQPADLQFRHCDEFVPAQNDNGGWTDGDYHIENCLQVFVLFVEELK